MSHNVSNQCGIGARLQRVPFGALDSSSAVAELIPGMSPTNAKLQAEPRYERFVSSRALQALLVCSVFLRISRFQLSHRFSDFGANHALRVQWVRARCCTIEQLSCFHSAIHTAPPQRPSIPISRHRHRRRDY
jgi:hypothetical protein